MWGADTSGRYRAKEYFERLALRDQAKFDPWFCRLADTGVIRNVERFRQEADNLFVFRVFKHRLVCFFDGPDAVLIDGFSKRSYGRNQRQRKLSTAARLRDEHLAALPKGRESE
jgi:hypothetical protein